MKITTAIQYIDIYLRVEAPDLVLLDAEITEVNQIIPSSTWKDYLYHYKE